MERSIEEVQPAPNELKELHVGQGSSVFTLLLRTVLSYK